MITSNSIATPSRTLRSAALCAVSSFALCVGFTPAAMAQEAGASDQEPEVKATDPAADDSDSIVVTGYRKSLATAQKVKRDADTVVDVISAEDIGALPDRSVAEALQRVPGVNISRFEQRDDPDRFSVEGSNVIVRGLPYVLSTLNGRDIFSANGGRVLSFNDVSPELLGRVEVYKNSSADMIEGNISGLVNLVTRKPLDSDGFHVAGTLEANYGDLAKKWSPGFSGLVSNTFDTGIGRFGVQLGYAQQELVTRTDASQITDPCYRAATLDGPCYRIAPVGSGGYSGGPNYTPDTFPPANSVLVPKGAGVRTTDLTRDRRAYSGVLQWASNDDRAKVTLEYLRAETEGKLDEFAVLALVNDDNLFPTPAGPIAFDSNGIFQSGRLTQQGGFGIPTELLRFQREDKAKTEDMSIAIELAPTDRLRFNIEVQHIKSDRSENGFIAAMQTYTDLNIDNSGETPVVQFLQPSTTGSPASYFNDPTKTLYWFAIDNQVRNNGSLTSMRADVEYDISDDGFFKTAKFGARWADRNRVTRSANFSNWGNLGAPWTGRNGNWNCDDYQAFGCGGAYVSDFPYAESRNPFGDDFQRGAAPVPLGDGSAFFFGGDNLVSDYLNGTIEQQANALNAFTLTPNPYGPIYNRNGLVAGTVFLPGEISNVGETTDAYYGRIDFGSDLSNGWVLSGNIGARYVKTEVLSIGFVNFPTPDFFDNPILDGSGAVVGGGNGDGVVTVGEVQGACSRVQPGQQAPGYCRLTPARQAEFAGGFTGETFPVIDTINFGNWLPSFNAKLDVGGGLLFRVAASKGISRPDLSAFRTSASISDNTGDLQQAGQLATGPLFQIFTGNRSIRPVEAWNYDFSIEWYFDRVGSLTLALFEKDFKNLFSDAPTVRSFGGAVTAPVDVEVNGPVNFGKAKLRGAELAYQQTFGFLPGLLSGLGTQLTYTYIDSKDFASSGELFGDLPQPGVSKHTVNATVFYEKGPLAARAAYNWRSEYLQTPRDVIFPFSPIYGEATGQLDASIFYSITPKIKIGVQGVNLLDEVTRTSQVVDYDGTRVRRSAFRNDRRYTLLARFDF
jgi:TonB-dependent receptor